MSFICLRVFLSSSYKKIKVKFLFTEHKLRVSPELFYREVDMNIAGIANNGVANSNFSQALARKPEVVERFVNSLESYSAYGNGKVKNSAQIRQAMANSTGVGKNIDVLA